MISWKRHIARGKNFFQRPRREDRGGSLLVEAMVALTLIIVGLLGILNLAAQSFRVNEDIADRFLGAHLAAEGIEIAKNIIDAKLAKPAPPPTPPITWQEVRDAIPSGDYAVEPSDTEFDNPHSWDTSWLQFSPINGYVYEGSDRVGPLFRRKVSVNSDFHDPIDASVVAIKVQSLVEWSVRGTMSSIVIEDIFYQGVRK